MFYHVGNFRDIQDFVFIVLLVYVPAAFPVVLLLKTKNR